MNQPELEMWEHAQKVYEGPVYLVSLSSEVDWVSDYSGNVDAEITNLQTGEKIYKTGYIHPAHYGGYTVWFTIGKRRYSLDDIIKAKKPISKERKMRHNSEAKVISKYATKGKRYVIQLEQSEYDREAGIYGVRCYEHGKSWCTHAAIPTLGQAEQIMLEEMKNAKIYDGINYKHVSGLRIHPRRNPRRNSAGIVISRYATKGGRYVIQLEQSEYDAQAGIYEVRAYEHGKSWCTHAAIPTLAEAEQTMRADMRNARTIDGINYKHVSGKIL